MTISVSFDAGLGAYVISFSGDALLVETLETLGGVYREHDVSGPLNMIFVDVGITRHYTRGELVTLMDFAKRNRPACPGRTAMVGGSDLSFGTFRMAEGVGGDFSRHIRTFRDLEGAKAWIVSGEASAEIA